MEALISVAVIFGSDNYVAVRLVQKLKEQGIKIVDGNIEEMPKNAAYIFDFEGREEEWVKLETNQKLVVVGESLGRADKWKSKLNETKLNWRIVVGENAYGEGMGEEGFLGQAFLTAARNKNLVLPSLEEVYRVLAVDDLVEAILRACFFSGTLGKIFYIGGRETNSKIVAEVLIDDAKMTRTKVIQNPPEEKTPGKLEEEREKMIKESQAVLRWQPEITFKQGAKKAVQYFVAKVDSDNRKKTMVKNKDFKPQIEEEKREKRYEVEIEEEDEEEEEKKEESLPPEADPPMAEKHKEEEEIEIEIESEEEEIVFESFIKSPIPERKVVEEKEENKESLKPKEEKKEKKKKNKWWGRGIGGFLLIIFAVFLVNFIKIVTIPKTILGVQSLIEEGNYVEAEKEIGVLAKNNEKNLAIFGEGKIGSLLRVEGEVVDLLKLSLDLVKSGEKISGGMFGDKEIEMGSALVEVEKKTEMVISKMGILQGRLSGQWGWLPGRYRGDLNKLKEKLEIQRKAAEKMREILKVLPEMIGVDGKRREYMVLLQNENEIRPSGGFIGSINPLHSLALSPGISSSTCFPKRHLGQ